jgi:hypothetical protein
MTFSGREEMSDVVNASESSDATVGVTVGVTDQQSLVCLKKKPTADRMQRAKEIFLTALAECGNVTYAASRAGIPRRTVYALRKKDEEFAKAWRESADIGVRILEDEACRRAMEGVETPVFYQGKEVGVVRKYSDTLLMALLKAHRPEKYADKYRIEQDHDGNFGEAMSRIIQRKRQRSVKKTAAGEEENGS